MILLPLPKHLEKEEGHFLLDLDTRIVMKPACPEGTAVYAGMLKEEIADCTGFNPMATRGCAKPGDIVLDIDPALEEEQYCLDIGTDRAVLCGGSLNSLGQSVQTLRQLVRQYAGLLPVLHIEDKPDFEVRGFFHDVTRGRVQTLPNLKKLADTMAFYKLNQLQLYIEHTYLFREIPELWRDETPLTSDEILELDAYCHARGIELVPCLASFGHLYKLLGTRSWEKLCELEGSAGQEFSFWDRMEHHTLNAADPGSTELILGMIGEFMQLFRSDKFNICADETFDLGTGRSRKVAEEKGRDRLYAEFISGLFDFLIKNGKKPMFWGDIICASPELLKSFPEEVVCLAWGYSEEQKDTEIRILHEAGTKQYVCPGTRGWNSWVNRLRYSYENITRMCGYGRKYGAIGVLNTDWGDYGHINHPAFSVPGLIYGAVFSWGDAGTGFDELNRQISILEFGDASGALVDCLARVSDTAVFGWPDAVMMKEWAQKGRDTEEILQKFREGGEEPFEEANRRAAELQEELFRIGRGMDSRTRPIIACTAVAIRAICAWNETGRYYIRRGKSACPQAEAGITAGDGTAFRESKVVPSENEIASEESKNVLTESEIASGENRTVSTESEIASGENRTVSTESEIASEESRLVAAGEETTSGAAGSAPEKTGRLLADELERCLYHFKASWRENSKEGDLSKISDVFFWHADLLRKEKSVG